MYAGLNWRRQSIALHRETPNGVVLGQRLLVPTPMPRLVNETMGVVARERHFESVFFRVQSQPSEGAGVGKSFLERRDFVAADVDGAAGVVLTVAGCGDGAEDVGNFFADGEFAADDFGLPLDTAETREWE